MFAVNYNNKILTLETLITFSNIGIDIFVQNFYLILLCRKCPCGQLFLSVLRVRAYTRRFQ